MKVSIIIPTYNGVTVLKTSLMTWFQQSLPLSDYEVILVDNNSTDNTVQIAKEFENRYTNFTYIKELKPGATNARHAGAKIANGDIFIFADNDGLFNPECVESILNVYQQNKDVIAVTGKIDLLWDKEAPDWIIPYEFMLGKLDYGNEVKYEYDLYLNGGLFSIKKSVFEEFHGFNPDLLGDYLIGDGDTGLVNKLHKAKYLIGYTPYAVMQHMQFVDKHGTIEGLGRHFYNTGITSSYGIFRKNNFSWSKDVLSFFLKNYLVYLKKRVEYVFDKKDRKKFFSYMHKRGQINFFSYLKDKELKREILNKNIYKK